ncbi:response regulator [Microvirga sp. HBU67558]|uniref:hybrid sensor histidine kinase/response regulator n=1 Tax=Microvirga TaxID=186650 RepID=UPI001B380045|nr:MULTISPECIES: hybrid sensor histidine kinase/response regulator [unclassified Microvirga]MBQ0819870.1 response regulator [Microvirga sp. HBU67558]
MSWDDIAASEDLHRWLLQLDQNLPIVDVIWLIDPEGRGRNSSRYFPAPDTSRVGDRDYFQALKDRPSGTYIGEPRLGRSSPGLFFNVARRRTAEAGFDGLIVTSLDPAYFAGALKSLSLSPDDSFSIIRDDGTILARGPQPLSKPMRLTAESGLMQAIQRGADTPYRQVAQLDGVERLYANRKLPGYPVYVSYGRSLQAVLAGWHKDLVLSAGLAFAVAGSLSGITFLAIRQTRQRLATQARLQESEARIHALLQEAPVGLLLTRVNPDSSLTIEEMNPALAAITGWSREQVIGRSPRDAFPGSIGATIEEHYRECLTSRQPVEYEVEGEGPSGPYIRHAVVRPIIDATGRVTKLLGTSMDVTRARELEEQLRRAQKMEAVAALVSGVAHDFNNLLTIMLGNLDLARRAKEDRKPRLIENAIQAIDQGRKLTGQLLAFGRRQALKSEVIEIPSLMAATHDMLAQSLRGDISIELNLAEDLWPVQADASQLQVALINLAVNARDAMPKGGSFVVTAQNLVLRDGGLTEAVAITVSDTGAGIPREVLTRVFEPFFTTKEVGRGSGLGLAQVYGFAQQSGGSVDIRSEPGRGTTVTLYLPRAARQDDSQLPSAHEQQDSVRRKLRVLLVEDNPEVAEVGRMLLTEAQHDVRVCGSVAEALAVLEAEAFDLVCSDLVMPGGQDGLDLARTVRERWPYVPVLLMSGYSDATGAAIEEGFPLLTKPYAPKAFLAKVDEAASGKPASGRVVRLVQPGR